MISDISFATGYQSFWDNITPYLGNYIKIKNLENGSFGEDEFPSGSNTDRRSLIAEYAYRVFCWEIKHYGKNIPNVYKNMIQIKAAKYIAGFGDNENVNVPLLEEELYESQEIINRLHKFFFNKKSVNLINPAPLFKGCGFIDMCQGDVLFENTLFEIKTVDRSFRATDIKQVLLYAALNSVSKQYTIKKLGLLNPRRRKFVEEDIEHISIQISGKPAQQLFDSIIFFISGGDLSK